MRDAVVDMYPSNLIITSLNAKVAFPNTTSYRLSGNTLDSPSRVSRKPTSPPACMQ